MKGFSNWGWQRRFERSKKSLSLSLSLSLKGRHLVTGRVYDEKHSLVAPTSADEGLLMSLQSASSSPLGLNLAAALVSRGRTHKALQIFDEGKPG